MTQLATNTTPNLGMHAWAGNDRVLREEMNDNFDKIDRKITEQLRFNTVNAMIPFPTTLPACKGDGTDDTEAINALLAYCDSTGVNLYFPKGTYGVSSTLTASGKFTISGERGGSVIQAISTMIDLMVLDKSNTNLSQNNAFRTGQLVDICFDGNTKADTSLRIKKGKGFTLRGVECRRPVVNACVIGTDTSSPTWELSMDDVILNATNDTGQAQYALVINQLTDSWFFKVLLINGSVNWLKVNLASATSFKYVHGYAYPETLAPDTGMDIYAGGNLTLSDIYCDTPKRVGMKVRGNWVSLRDVTVALKTGYIDTGTSDICAVDISGSNHKVDDIYISMADSAKQSRTCVVVFDNSSNNIYDFQSGYLAGGVGSYLSTDLKLLGKVPTRFRFNGGTQTTESFKTSNSQFLNQVVYQGDVAKTFTFKNARLSAVYKVDVETSWNTSWWITNKTATGFTVNFGTTPSGSNGTINVDVSL